VSPFFVAETSPFLVATLVLVGIGVVEGLGLLIGLSPTHWLDNLFELPEHGVLESVLGWLHLGKVPILALIVIFLATFAVVGFGLNLVAHGLLGLYVPALIGAPIAFVAALPAVRGGSRVLAHVIPRDETSAVSIDSLVGRIATVVSGTARVGYPAQARVATEHGQTIYVMVEPDDAELTFPAGEQVLLVKRLTATRFQGIRNPKPNLL
jgi:Inner membrane protein YqiJ, N-terminal/Inner membrane protein YqiJ, OB-fold